VELAAPHRVVQADSAPNVVAVLRGRDRALRDEYGVVSAHMDHVGEERGLADSVFNGADDNASGTAALLEIARALAALPPAQRPRRSVLFLAVSGEEHGLLGSQWFVAHPTVPLARVVANVNLDMIGRNAPDTVIGIGMEYSTLGDDARAAAGPHRLAIVSDPQPEERHFLRSDQYSFARGGIPAIMLTTGPHADYHKASDEAARLDADKAARVARLALDLVRRVADAGERPRWTSAGQAIVQSLRR
jgi:Zn-dependent M28 family amino/carboxypeptidase